MNKTDKTDDRNYRKEMLKLEVGQATKPISDKKYNSIKAACYSYGVETGNKYSIKRDKETKTVTVTRKA